MQDWLGLEGKIAVVTGGAVGIGYGIAACFIEAGAAVAILDRSETDAQSAASRLGGRAIGIGCDVSDRAAVTAAERRVRDELGIADVLVNNAGILRPGAFATLTIEDWRAILDVNLTGALHCSQIFGAPMLERRSGALVHIASVAGTFPQGMSGAYSASKAALLQLSAGLATEWGPAGVRSNCVSPGGVRSNMSAPILAVPGVEEARIRMSPLRRIGDPADIGNAVLFLSSQRASYVTGQNLIVDGGYTLTPLDMMPRPGFTRESTGAPG